MAHKEAVPEIPDFEAYFSQRRAEVSPKKKERKGAGLPWWPNFAATKGLGVGAQVASVLASKAGILLVCMSLSATAGVLGLAQKNRLRAEEEAMKRKQFQASLLRDHILKQNAQIKAGIPTVDRARNDTLGYVSAGSLAAPTAGDGAANAAGAAGAAGSGDGKGAGEAGGSKKEEGPGAMDPNALAAEMMAKAGGAQGAAGAAAGAGAGNFGRLSQGMGGGMRGGAGMSGGVGRGFDQMGMRNAMLAKAQAFRGGNEAGLMDNKVRRGNPRKWEARGSRTAAARSSATAKRLAKMSADMNANRTGDVAKTASANTAAWENSAAPGMVTSGPGASTPGAGGQSGGGIGAFPGEQEGGPINAGPGDVGGLASSVPTIPDYVNATPYQWAVDLAKMLMIAILALSVIIMIMKATVIGNAYIPMLLNVLAGLGAILGILGVYMMAMDQYAQGMLWTVIGGAVTVLALAAPSAVTAGAKSIAIGWQGFVIPLLGAAGWGMGDSANSSDTDGFREEEKANYRKKYGVDPESKKVLNREKFDERYGEGAAERWDDQRQYDDMR